MKRRIIFVNGKPSNEHLGAISGSNFSPLSIFSNYNHRLCNKYLDYFSCFINIAKFGQSFTIIHLNSSLSFKK